MTLINLVHREQIARRFEMFRRAKPSLLCAPGVARLVWRVFVRSRGRCVYCGSIDRDFDVDHIVPVARGGSDEIANKAIACRRCNRTKNYATAEEIGRGDLQVERPSTSLDVFMAGRRERVRATRQRHQ